MRGINTNRRCSGSEVKTLSAGSLHGCHDPDTLFYHDRLHLNWERCRISVTFPCLTHLLHLNNSVSETNQHQSRKALVAPGTFRLCISLFGLITQWVHACARLGVCLRERESEDDHSKLWLTAPVLAWLTRTVGPLQKGGFFSCCTIDPSWMTLTFWIQYISFIAGKTNPVSFCSMFHRMSPHSLIFQQAPITSKQFLVSRLPPR